MSSHHFVRDGQEPTLVIVSIAPASFEHTKTLLEWSPNVFVAESALETVLPWNIKIDGVLVRPSHIQQWQRALTEQEPLQWVQYSDGSMMNALRALAALNHDNLQTVDDVGMLPLPELQLLPCETITVIREQKRWSLIRGKKWTKWVPAGTALSMVWGQNEKEHTVTEQGSHTIVLPPPFWVGEAL
ncbi:MAG: hypothetical protein ACKOE6_04235 [Flammeovirgaceae bacterium]